MPNSATPEISVVSPVYGCGACLESLVDGIAAAVHSETDSFEVILVDDCSPDDAWSQIVRLARERPWLHGIRLSRNFGQHYAISAGIEHANGSKVVVMDCDLQDDPREIPLLLHALGQPGVEVAFAQRIERKDSFMKRLGSLAFYRFLSWLTGVQQDHTTANFGAFSRKVINAVNSMPERDRCFPLMVKWTGFSTARVPVAHAKRAKGKSGYSLRRLVSLAIDIILSYSDKPLRLVVRLGLAFSLLAFGMVVLSVVRFIRGETQLAGFTSIVASIWLVGGVVIFCLGIVGLYVGKQFTNAKSRPYYIIGEETPYCTPKPSGSTAPNDHAKDSIQ